MTDAKPRSPSLAVGAIATFFGAGHAPFWPGTFGTLAAMPLVYGVMGLGRPALLATAVVLTWVGTWAAGRYCQQTGTHDNQHIVIDEVVGILVAMSLVPRTWPNLIAGFVLFRILDAWKPGPIGLVDRRVHGGFGVMADDITAGAVVAGLLWLIQPSRLPFAIPGWGGP